MLWDAKYSVAIFSCQSLLLNTSLLNDIWFVCITYVELIYTGFAGPVGLPG